MPSYYMSEDLARFGEIAKTNPPPWKASRIEALRSARAVHASRAVWTCQANSRETAWLRTMRWLRAMRWLRPITIRDRLSASMAATDQCG